MTALLAVSGLAIVKSHPVNAFQLNVYCSALLVVILLERAFAAILCSYVHSHLATVTHLLSIAKKL